MSLWTRLKLLSPSARRAAERDMREELEALRDLAGPSELGNLTRAAEDARGVLVWAWLDQLAQDIRYGLRSMGHNKAFAVLAVGSLGVGIGANTAIYSFFDAILLRPLPVTDPESLVVMKWRAKGYTLARTGWSSSTDGSWSDPAVGRVSSIFPYPALELFQRDADVLASAFGYFIEDRLGVTVGDTTDAVMGQYVSGNYFQGIGVAPIAGRVILPADDQEGRAAVAVISERLSRRRFDTPQVALGQTIRLNDKPFTVVGVAPASFFGAEPGAIPDVYVPIRAALMLLPSMTTRRYLDQHYYWLEIMARLKPGVTLDQAHAALAPRFHQFVERSASTDKERQDLPQLRIENGALGLDSLRRRYARPIYVLMTMVGLVLLIACSNIASLLLARATARRREIAVRLSIGASRGRVIRQLLTESLLLSVAGGVVGLALASWGIGFLTVLLSSGRDNFTLHAELNWTVLGVTFAVSLVSGVLFGLAPALQATRLNIVPALKDANAARNPLPSRRPGVRHALVALQVALAVVLLAAAALFGRTLTRLHGIELGFARENVLLFTLRPSTIGYAGPALARLYEDLRQRLEALPGVEAVGSSIRPMPMGGGTMAPVDIVGAAKPSLIDGKPAGKYAVLATVGPGFFETMRMPLVAGRTFTARDIVGSPAAVIVNRQFAAMFGIPSPVGQTMALETRALEKTRYEIIGMVEDALAFVLKEERQPIAYFSYLQDERPAGIMTFELRTAGHPLGLATPVRQVVRETDSRLAIYDLKTQEAHVDQAISTEMTLARLSSVSAALALAIAGVGVYGTIAFTVARRTTEIGIRMALGARARRIVWMVTRDAVLMTVAGLVVGLVLVLAGSRYVEALLYETQPRDPVAIGAAIAGLLVCGLAAGLVPARRATRIDPLRAIRCE